MSFLGEDKGPSWLSVEVLSLLGEWGAGVGGVVDLLSIDFVLGGDLFSCDIGAVLCGDDSSLLCSGSLFLEGERVSGTDLCSGSLFLEGEQVSGTDASGGDGGMGCRVGTIPWG